MPHFTTRYGHFSDDALEYVITLSSTPMPWVNVVSNGDYGVVLSQAGSGYSWRTRRRVVASEAAGCRVDGASWTDAFLPRVGRGTSVEVAVRV